MDVGCPSDATYSKLAYAPIDATDGEQLCVEMIRREKTKEGILIKFDYMCANVIHLEDSVNTTRTIVGNGETVVSIRRKIPGK